MEGKVSAENLQELQQKISHAEEIKRISDQIHTAKDLDHILLDFNKDILNLFDAEDLMLYAVDPDRKEIFSKIQHADTVNELRVPISEQSLAGFTAKYLRPVNVNDAYNKAELARHSPCPLS